MPIGRGAIIQTRALVASPECCASSAISRGMAGVRGCREASLRRLIATRGRVIDGAWSRSLPRPLLIPKVMTLATLADVRELIVCTGRQVRPHFEWGN
jgi:hypothetical protein